jgi:hypothetical protein
MGHSRLDIARHLKDVTRSVRIRFYEDHMMVSGNANVGDFADIV